MCLNLEKSEFASGIRRAKANSQVGLKTENVQMFSSACFIYLVCQHLCEGNAFLLQICSPQCTAVLVHSLSRKSREGLAHDVFDPFPTHASPICNVTDTDCWTQNGSTHVHVFFLQISNVDFLTNKSGNQLKNTAFIFLFFYF